MRVLWFLLEKEFKQIFRDKFMPKIMVALPMIQLLVLPFAANFEMKNIRLSVVDYDKTAYSRRLTEKIENSGYFILAGVSSSRREAMLDIEQDEVDMLLEIPAFFERDYYRDQSARLSISANAINGSKGGIGTAYLNTLIREFNAELISEDLSGPRQTVPQIRMEVLNRYNPLLDYRSYMVPGIIVFLISLVSGFVASLNIVNEKEKGTMEQLNVTPISKGVFIASKIIPFWILGFFVFNLGMLIARLVYGLVPVGALSTLYIFAMAYLFVFTGFGVLISTYSSTRQQALFTAYFFLMLFIMLSGLFTPVSSMPAWAQKVTLFNPLSYFVLVMRNVYLKGSGFWDLIPQFLAIVSFAVVFNVWAVWNHDKSVR